VRAEAERGQIEVGAQLAVHAPEQVLVERGRHAGRVVVRQLEDRRILLEVVADQHAVAGRQAAASSVSSSRASSGSKLPMFDPRTARARDRG